MFGIEGIKARLKVIENTIFRYGMNTGKEEYSKIKSIELDIIDIRKTMNANTDKINAFIKTIGYELSPAKTIEKPMEWVKIKKDTK